MAAGNYGLAVLSGLLGGLGSTAIKGSELGLQAGHLGLQHEQLQNMMQNQAQAQQLRQAEFENTKAFQNRAQTMQEQENFLTMPRDPLSAAFGKPHPTDPNSVIVPKQALLFLQEQQRIQLDRQLGRQQAASMEPLPGAGAGPGSETPPLTPGARMVVDALRNLGAKAGEPLQAKYLADIFEQEKEARQFGRGQQMWDASQQGGTPATGTAGAPGVPDYTSLGPPPVERTFDSTGKVSLIQHPWSENERRIHAALINNGYTTNMPEYATQFQNQRKLVSMFPGGAVVGAGQVIPSVEETRRQMGGQTGGGVPVGAPGGIQPLAIRPTEPVPPERAALVNLDTAMQSLDKLIVDTQKPEIKSMLGGWFGNPMGAGQRALSNVFTGVLSQAQQDYRANFGRTVALVKHQILGSAQTSTELKTNAAALPDEASPDDKTLAQLQAIQGRYGLERANWGNILGQSNVIVPKPPQDAAPSGLFSPAPSTPKGALRYDPRTRSFAPIEGQPGINMTEAPPLYTEDPTPAEEPFPQAAPPPPRVSRPPVPSPPGIGAGGAATSAEQARRSEWLQSQQPRQGVAPKRGKVIDINPDGTFQVR